MNFANLDLSAFYLDVAKDRLYISSCDAWRRRSCQTVLAAVLEQLAAAMGPLVPHLAEEAFQSILTAVAAAANRFFRRAGRLSAMTIREIVVMLKGVGARWCLSCCRKVSEGM